MDLEKEILSLKRTIEQFKIEIDRKCFQYAQHHYGDGLVSYICRHGSQVKLDKDHNNNLALQKTDGRLEDEIKTLKGKIVSLEQSIERNDKYTDEQMQEIKLVHSDQIEKLIGIIKKLRNDQDV